MIAVTVHADILRLKRCGTRKSNSNNRSLSNSLSVLPLQLLFGRCRGIRVIPGYTLTVTVPKLPRDMRQDDFPSSP